MVSVSIRVPLLLLPFELLPEELLVLLLFDALSKLLSLLLLLSLAVTPPVLTEVRERPRRDIIR